MKRHQFYGENTLINNLLVCFSGGKTSAYMTKKIKESFTGDLRVVFANTGQENDETLEFVRDCDRYFGFETVWLEAEVQERNTATSFKVVDFESANRDGAIFETVIQKYGIPNVSYPHCTRELKERPLHSYVKAIGWARGNYQTAIGIRTDETRRVRKTKDYQNIVYPLVDWFPADKDDVNDFWEDQKFNLKLAEHKGNCKWCWKKSLKKHSVLIHESPEIYNFPRKMEQKYGYAGHNDGVRKRVFFRGNRSTDDLFKLSETTGTVDQDLDGGCSESCEIYATT